MIPILILTTSDADNDDGSVHAKKKTMMSLRTVPTLTRRTGGERWGLFNY